MIKAKQKGPFWGPCISGPALGLWTQSKPSGLRSWADTCLGLLFFDISLHVTAAGPYIQTLSRLSLGPCSPPSWLALPCLPRMEAGLVWGAQWDRLSQGAASGPTVPALPLQEDPRSGCSVPAVSVPGPLRTSLPSGRVPFLPP